MYKIQLKFFIAFSLLVASCLFAQQFPTSCTGKPNLQNPSIATPRLIKQVPNGNLTIVDTVTPPIYVVHVYGTDYEMGYAYGSLLAPQINTLVTEFYDYIYTEINQYLQYLPEFMRKAIEEGGVAAGLELTYLLTEPYTPKHFFDEMKGISDGAKVDYMTFLRVQMFPEMIQAACSMFGAWGPAINKTNGTMYQLRALDWDTKGPFQQFPVLAVYHPSEGYGHTFATASYAGFVGTLTGFSSTPIGVCEKVWDAYGGSKPRDGYPWHFLLRDILQYDTDSDQALSRMASAKRTCSIWVGLGEWKSNKDFKIVGYSADSLEIHNQYNTVAYPGHPVFPGLLYLDKHVQPSKNPCMGDLMTQFYGDFTPLNTIQYITALAETGDAQLAVFDYGRNEMYLAYASPVDKDGNVVEAYRRPAIRLSMTDLFNY